MGGGQHRRCPNHSRLNPLLRWRPLRNLSISPTAAPITLTLILSQDGRGDKRDGYDGYAKVSRMGEEVRGERGLDAVGVDAEGEGEEGEVGGVGA